MPRSEPAEDEGVRRPEQGRRGTGAAARPPAQPQDVEEIGGPKGPEPTRYGDWEKAGRCTDF